MLNILDKNALDYTVTESEYINLPTKVAALNHLIKFLDFKIAHKLSPCNQNTKEWEDYNNQLKSEVKQLNHRINN